MTYIHKPCGLLYDTAEALYRHSTHCPQTSHSSNPLTGFDDLQARPSGRETGMHSYSQTSHSQQPDYGKQMVEGVTRSACVGLRSEKQTAGNGTSHSQNVQFIDSRLAGKKSGLLSACPCDSGASQ